MENQEVDSSDFEIDPAPSADGKKTAVKNDAKSKLEASKQEAVKEFKTQEA